MRSEEAIDDAGTAVKGPFAVYLDMLDTHAIENLETIDGGGVPVTHSLWLMPPALILSVFTLSATPMIVGMVMLLLWTIVAARYYWRAHRQHRIAMGLPAWPLTRYGIRHGRVALGYGAALVALQELIRYFH